MKYALWNLKLENVNYLSGPEQTIYESGGYAEASWSNGPVELGATILGYITGTFEADISAWNYREITQEEALEFCQTINPNAFLDQDGRIAVAAVN